MKEINYGRKTLHKINMDKVYFPKCAALRIESFLSLFNFEPLKQDLKFHKTDFILRTHKYL